MTRRVHIAQSTDWKDAVIALLEPRSRLRPWQFGTDDADEGDSIVFLLNTDPPSVVATLARVTKPGHPSKAFFKHPLYHANLLELPTLAMLLGVELHAFDTWQFDGDDAIKIDLTLGQCRHGSEPQSRFGHNTLAAARTLLRFHAMCHGCERTIDLKRSDARDELVVHTVDPYVRPNTPLGWDGPDTADWPAVMCRRCHGRMVDEGHDTFVDFKFAMNPPCPACDAQRTFDMFYGMPNDPRNIPPWRRAAGCCVSSEEWACSACDHSW